MSETQIRRYAKSDPASAFFVPPKYRRRLVDLDDCDPEKRAYLLGTYFSVQSKGSKTKYARTTSSLQ